MGSHSFTRHPPTGMSANFPGRRQGGNVRGKFSVKNEGVRFGEMFQEVEICPSKMSMETGRVGNMQETSQGEMSASTLRITSLYV